MACVWLVILNKSYLIYLLLLFEVDSHRNPFEHTSVHTANSNWMALRVDPHRLPKMRIINAVIYITNIYRFTVHTTNRACKFCRFIHQIVFAAWWWRTMIKCLFNTRKKKKKVILFSRSNIVLNHFQQNRKSDDWKPLRIACCDRNSKWA